ncbi:MAG TPA: T9SS type A sorting domain-containing protein, partial [Saprospiraceae bacterium]
VINEDIPIDGVASLSSDQIIAVFPNPGSDKVQVKLEFTQSYSDVKLRLIDNLGRVVYYKALDQTITEHVETISVNDLPSGNYILQVETIDGQRSVPVIVTK